MSSQPLYNEIVELLPLYVLGTLEPDEMLLVDDFVQEHPELQPRIAELEEAIGLLAYSAPDAPLPEDARQQLLGRVQADLQTVPPASAPIDQISTPRPTVRLETRPSFADRVRDWTAGLRRRALPIGAALALLVGAFYVGQLQTRLDRLRAQEQQLLALLADPDQTVAVPGTELAPDASAVFYRDGNQGAIVVEGLQPLPATQSYQLWLVIDGQPTPFGLLNNPQPGTPAFAIVDVPPEAQDFSIVDVSIERAGGSDTITVENVVLRGSVE